MKPEKKETPFSNILLSSQYVLINFLKEASQLG